MLSHKKILATAFIIFASLNMLFSQMIGGRGNGQSAPKEVAPATLNKGALTSDVNLLNGALNSSYSLGSVSTPSGLNYALSLNYNSTATQSDNIMISSGIPYGEGWNINIPSITIETEDFHKYNEAQMALINTSAVDPYFFNMTEAEAKKEGTIQWFSPKINIPGVISERFVFKYSDGQEAVFVPACFESYVEARFNGQVWKVIASDGTIYFFDDIQANSRNASNQRVLGEGVAGFEYHIPKPEVLKNLILPKYDIVAWYCSSITNPEHSAGQAIVFEYEKFGEFNYYKEFMQPQIMANLFNDSILTTEYACIPGLGAGWIPEPFPKLSASKDLLLKSVSATSWSSLIEKIDLNYKTAYPVNGPTQQMLLPGQTGVSRLDSLYNYKTVYSVGLSNGSGASDGSDVTLMNGTAAGSGAFNNWWRYNHIKSDLRTQLSGADHNFASASNPYIFTYGSVISNNTFYDRTAITSGNNLSFSHGFLESPRIGGTGTTYECPAGDIYEIKSLIINDNTDLTKFCNYDINIVSGDKDGADYYAGATSGPTADKFPSAVYENSIKNQTIFSTFNQAVKWNTTDLVGGHHIAVTSNYFTMPSLPQEFEGFNIQIGPANSDHQFDFSLSDIYARFHPYASGSSTTFATMDANMMFLNNIYDYRSDLDYYNANGLLPAGNSIASAHTPEPSDPAPNNFGIGLNWQMMDKFYARMDYSTTSATSSYDRYGYRQRFWWNDNATGATTFSNFTWANEPTAANEDVVLRAMELIRYSKNPYMLSEVNHYKVNGEIDGITNPGLQLTSKLVLDYDVMILDIFNNKIYPLALMPTVNGARNIYVLKDIKQVPVNPSTPAIAVTFDIDKVPATRFEYGIEDNLFATVDVGFATGYSPGLSKVVVLNRIIDQLGGVTAYDYYPQRNPGYPVYKSHITNTYYPRASYSAAYVAVPVNIKPDPYSMQIYFAVKDKKVYSETDLVSGGMIKQWDYDYIDPVSVQSLPLPSGLGDHFRLSQTFRTDVGFKKTIVTNPVVETGVARTKTIYYHRTNEDNNKLFGKLYKTEEVDENGNTIKKTVNTYKVAGAYFNASYAGASGDVTRDVPDADYLPVPVPLVNHHYAGPTITWSVDQEVLFLESVGDDVVTTPAAGYKFTGDYLNSYFIKKINDTVTAYDYYALNSIYDVAVSGTKSGITSGIKNLAIPAGACAVKAFANNKIETVTEYHYWDASPGGYTNCEGYKKLLGTARFYDDSVALNFEPSWQLYSKKTYSPQLPNAYTREEYFYYYDLINFFDVKFISGFDVVYNARINELRDLVYEARTTTKAVAKDPVTSSEYYLYDSKWNEVESFDPMVTVPFTGSITDCSGLPGWSSSPPGTTAPADCEYIRYWTGEAPPAGYVLHFYNGFAYFCPGFNPATAGGSTGATGGTRMTIINTHTDPNDPAPALPNVNQWISGKIAFRKTYQQADQEMRNPNYTTAMNLDDTRILRFRTVPGDDALHDDVYIPEFPFDTLMTYEVKERNQFGQVQLEKDEKGTLTRYQYTLPHNVFHQDVTNGCNNYSGISYVDIGIPTGITVGETSANATPLVTAYTYNPDRSLNDMTDENGAVIHFTYDEYGRLKEKYLNGQRLSISSYKQFENTDVNQALNFNQRLDQNYVETYTFNDQASNVAIHTRAYIDPLGRSLGTMAQISPDATTAAAGTQMVHSGQIIYDNWGRAVQNYKPFVYTDAAGVSFVPRYNLGTTTAHPYPQEYTTATYEQDQNERVLRSAAFGENITTGHTQNISYRFIRGSSLSGELGLSLAERAQIIPGASSSYVFTKVMTTDEDGKKVIVYTNPAGQKVASKQYITAAQAAVTLFVYDSRGNLCKVINPLKQEATYEYNLLGWMFRKHTVDGGTSKYMFNRSGRVVMEQDENAGAGTDNGGAPYVRVYTYDDLGRMIRQTKAQVATGSTYVYMGDSHFLLPLEYASYNQPAAGTGGKRILDFSDATTCDFTFNEYVAGTVTTSHPDGRYALTPYTDITSSPVPEKEWTYDFDNYSYTYSTPVSNYLSAHSQQHFINRVSQTTSYTPAGAALDYCLYSYNTEGRLDYEIHQLSKGTTIIPSIINYPSYNLQGSLKKQQVDINLDGTTEMEYNFGYDSWNRLHTVSVFDGQLADYTYDDALGHLVETHYTNSETPVCSTAVDDITYTYDVRERLTATSSRFFDESLYYDGALPSTGTPVYDVAATKNFNGNINAGKAQYKLSTAGNYSSIGNIMDGYTYYGYTYDALNRLTNADASVSNVLSSAVAINPALKYGDEAYTYDKIGNILALNRGLYFGPSATVPAVTADNWNYSYQAGKNRLAAVSVGSTAARSYTYDDAGNLRTDTYKGVSQTTYDRANLPVDLTVGSSILHYNYDADDSRIYKESATSREYYLQDKSGKTIGIYDITNNSWEWYAYGKDRIAKFGSTKEFFEYDHLGNTRVAFSNSYNCISHASTFTVNNAVDYYPYGKVLRSYNGLATEKFLFTGKERDAETQLDYLGARFFDSDIARFESLDPLQMKFANINPYNYVLGNPIHLTDKDGREPGEPIYDFFVKPFVDLANSMFSKVANEVEYNHDEGSGYKTNVPKDVQKLRYDVINLRSDLQSAAAIVQINANAQAAMGVAGAGIEAIGLISSVRTPVAYEPKNLQSEKSPFNEAQAKNLIRFNKDMPVGALPTETFNLPENGKAFQATVPGNVPKSYAIYEKQVDGAGKTQQFTKTTIDPNGNALHVVNKMAKPETRMSPYEFIKK